MRSRDFSLALAVLHTFDMASLALQHAKVRESFTQQRSKTAWWLTWRVRCFFVVFLGVFSERVVGCIAAVNGRHTSSSSASRRKSLADRHLARRSRLLPCTLALLHAVDVASLALQRNHVRHGGILCRSSSAKRLVAPSTGFSVVFCCCVCSVSGCFFF